MAFCPNCGASLEEGSKFCVSCGSPVSAPASPNQQPGQQPASAYDQQPNQQPASVSGQQPVQQAVQQPNQQPVAAPMPPGQPQPASSAEEHPEYQKLGGWLLVFVIGWGLAALSSFGTLITTLNTLGTISRYASSLAPSVIMSGLVVIVSIAVDIAMVVLIVQRNQSFLRLYQICSFVQIALVVVMSILVGTSLTHVRGASLAGAAAGTSVGVVSGLIGGVVGLLLTTLYFCKSVRVRTYMGSDEYLNRAIFRLGNKQ